LKKLIMKTLIRRVGSSLGIIIPKLLLAEIGARAGDKVDIKVESGKIVVALLKRTPREGWAEASRGLAAAREAGLVWPEFGNEDDKCWTW
jgi:antitoxin MazE